MLYVLPDKGSGRSGDNPPAELVEETLPTTIDPYRPRQAGGRPDCHPGAVGALHERRLAASVDWRQLAMIGAAGLAIGCFWLGLRIGGAASSALDGAATLIILAGLVVLLRQRGRLEQMTRSEAALRDQHKRFAALVDNLPGVVFQGIQDASGQVTYSYFSDRLRDYLGIAAAEAEADAGQLFKRFDRRAVRDWLEALAARRRPGDSYSREFEIIDPVGEARWIMIVTRSRPGAAGTTIWDGIATDISELKEWQQQLVAAKEQAILANRSKSQFLAVMSHELRTPLNAVIGFAEVLQAEFFGPLTEKQRGYIGDILESGTHLLDIINDILDLAKIEAGKSELHEDVCAAADIVAYQIQLIRPRAQQAGLSIEFRPAPDLPLLYADQTKLKQMLLNLLSNAIKFTPAGGRITVALQLVAVPEGRPMLGLSIADSGVGMAAEDIPNAFASFQQIDNRLARKHEGAGLGLPLVKAQIELHGGTVTIESALDVGTTVTLHFPAWRLFRSIEELPAVVSPA
jgi:signal transduction histidine kinase